MIGTNDLVEKACKVTKELLEEGKKIYDSMRGVLNHYGGELVDRFVEEMLSSIGSQPYALVENPNDMLEYSNFGHIIDDCATVTHVIVIGNGQNTLRVPWTYSRN